MHETYKVYIKVDAKNAIIAINSSAFLADVTGWVCIDDGIGDKYHHAQGHYFERPLIDECWRYNYQYIDGVVTEIAESDKPHIPTPEPEPSMEEYLVDLDFRISKIELGLEV